MSGTEKKSLQQGAEVSKDKKTPKKTERNHILEDALKVNQEVIYGIAVTGDSFH